MHIPRAILFDWDNTLVDSWGTIYASLHETFIKMDCEPMTFEQVKAGYNGIHGSLRTSFPNIFGSRWEEARDHYYDSFLEVHLDKITKFSGAEMVLDALSATNIYVAIVSNKTGQYLRDEVAHLKWNDYFHSIIGATDATRDKPYPEPIYMALEGSGINFPEDCVEKDVWMIGDSNTDIMAASNAGVRPVLFGDNDVNMDIDDVLHFLNHEHLLDTIIKF